MLAEAWFRRMGPIRSCFIVRKWYTLRRSRYCRINPSWSSLPSKNDWAIDSDNSSDSDAADRNLDCSVSGLNRCWHKKRKEVCVSDVVWKMLETNYTHLLRPNDIRVPKYQKGHLPKVHPVVVGVSLPVTFEVRSTPCDLLPYFFEAQASLPPKPSCDLMMIKWHSPKWMLKTVMISEAFILRLSSCFFFESIRA